MVIIKTNDLCNRIGTALLNYDLRSKFVFLTDRLKTFLLSVLRTEERREWVRARNKSAKEFVRIFPALADINPDNLSDAEAAAYLWLFNQMTGDCFEDGQYFGRTLAVNCHQMLSEPLETLEKVACLFSLPYDDVIRAHVRNHWSVSRHSKDLSRQYDANSRESILKRAEERYGAEAELGIEWASGLVAQSIIRKGSYVENITD
ncbi:MAG: hypothetical protein WBE47_15670 [Candidatus Acidiferrales bacterium]